MEKLNNNNYFSLENQIKYTGSSQIKDFLNCEACALAKLKGEWIENQSKAMAISSYIDAIFSNEKEEFLKVEHEKVDNKENSFIVLKSHNLSSDAQLAEKVCEQASADEMFMKYMSGNSQVIMTGEISNVPVKIKIDSYHQDKAIVDLKCIKDFDLIWNEKKHCKQNFIDAYDYVLQAALYQEVVKQNTGKQLPFIIAACTKQEYSQRALLQIPQDKIDEKLEWLIEILPHIQDLKQGKVEPTECNKCFWCISKRKCDRIWFYDDYFTEREEVL